MYKVHLRDEAKISEVRNYPPTINWILILICLGVK